MTIKNLTKRLGAVEKELKDTNVNDKWVVVVEGHEAAAQEGYTPTEWGKLNKFIFYSDDEVMTHEYIK